MHSHGLIAAAYLMQANADVNWNMKLMSFNKHNHVPTNDNYVDLRWIQLIIAYVFSS